VLVPVEVWKRFQATARPSLKELLLTDVARMDIPIGISNEPHKVEHPRQR